jgi:hypothetical protein
MIKLGGRYIILGVEHIRFYKVWKSQLFGSSLRVSPNECLGDVGSVASDINRAATWASRCAGVAEKPIETGDPVHTGSVGGVGSLPRRRPV